MPLPGPQLSASQPRLQPQPSLRAPPASTRVCVGFNCSQFIIKIYRFKWSIRCIQRINIIHVYIISDLTLFHAATY